MRRGEKVERGWGNGVLFMVPASESAREDERLVDVVGAAVAVDRSGFRRSTSPPPRLPPPHPSALAQCSSRDLTPRAWGRSRSRSRSRSVDVERRRSVDVDADADRRRGRRGPMVWKPLAAESPSPSPSPLSPSSLSLPLNRKRLL